MNIHAIHHIPDVPYAYSIDKDTLRVSIKVAKNDIKECILCYRCRYDYQSSFKESKMNLFEEDNLFEIYSLDISIFRNRYRYYFKLIDNNGETLYYDERGIKKDIKGGENLVAFQYAYIGQADVYEESKWLQEAIIYQIFPDRFNRSNLDKDIKNIMPWGGKVGTHSVFGGDINGMTNKVEYLKELGINLIYLTPIFKSSSNHKYNIDDYYQIAPEFGTINDLKRFINKCHSNNIKVILDGVFNHTGAGFFAFEDILTNQELSKYKDWYHIDSFPVSKEKINYYTFANGIAKMPKLNTANKEVKEYFQKVVQYWIKETDVDGWRFDVCDEVDHQFWREMRIAIKEVKNDAVLIGEIMHESISFLRGEQLDSIMNYPFKHAMVDFFAKKKISSKEFNDILATNRYIYMESITKQLLNLIGSHDTARFITESKNHIARLKLAVVFQYTYLGVPYIYYGDEVGVEGGEDPQCRRCMIWDEKKQNKELLQHYKKMALIRKENKELIHGKYKAIDNEDNLLIYERYDNANKIITIINNNEIDKEINLNLDNKLVDLYYNSVVVNNNIKIRAMDFIIIKVIKNS